MLWLTHNLESVWSAATNEDIPDMHFAQVACAEELTKVTHDAVRNSHPMGRPYVAMPARKWDAKDCDSHKPAGAALSAGLNQTIQL